MEKPSRFLANSSTALEQLRGLINQHESTPGIPLPTERELSDTLGVGRRESASCAGRAGRRGAHLA